MSWKYDGEDDCQECEKLSEVNSDGLCLSCYEKEDEPQADDDYNEKCGYSKGYINFINKGGFL